MVSMRQKGAAVAQELFKFEKVSASELELAAIARMQDMYSQLIQLYNERLVPFETAEFFQIEFINLILCKQQRDPDGAGDQGSKARGKKASKEQGGLAGDYLGRLEELFRQQMKELGADPTRMSHAPTLQQLSAFTNRYSQRWGKPVAEAIEYGQADADLTEGWQDEDALSRNDGLLSPTTEGAQPFTRANAKLVAQGSRSPVDVPYSEQLLDFRHGP